MVTDTAAMRADEQQLRQESPTLGYYFAYGGSQLQGLAVQERPDARAGGVQGFRPRSSWSGPPETRRPRWSGPTSCASSLGNAALLTWKGEGHTAYGRSNDCISNAVDSYVVDGKSPADNTVC